MIFELKNFESNKSHINSYTFLQLLKNKPNFLTHTRESKFFFVEYFISIVFVGKIMDIR